MAGHSAGLRKLNTPALPLLSRPGSIAHRESLGPERQHACGEFTELLGDHDITQSMTRKGNYWDNAPAESFFKTLKSELDMPKQYENYQSAKNAIFSFIEIWYNRKRRHSTLKYQTQAEAKQTLKKKQAA